MVTQVNDKPLNIEIFKNYIAGLFEGKLSGNGFLNLYSDMSRKSLSYYVQEYNENTEHSEEEIEEMEKLKKFHNKTQTNNFTSRVNTFLMQANIETYQTNFKPIDLERDEIDRSLYIGNTVFDIEEYNYFVKFGKEFSEWKPSETIAYLIKNLKYFKNCIYTVGHCDGIETDEYDADIAKIEKDLSAMKPAFYDKFPELKTKEMLEAEAQLALEKSVQEKPFARILGLVVSNNDEM